MGTMLAPSGVSVTGQEWRRTRSGNLRYWDHRGFYLLQGIRHSTGTVLYHTGALPQGINV